MSSYRDPVEGADLAAAEEWYYCPVCVPDPDAAPTVDVVDSRFATERALTIHLLQGHDKTDLVAVVAEEVEPR